MPRSRRSTSPVRRPMAEQRRASPQSYSRQPAPVHPQPSSVQAAGSQGPGLMGQMAATAGGVAVGSVVGHGISHALFGGSNSEAVSQNPQPNYEQPMQQQQQQPQACGWELQQFLNCAQSQHDISLCEGFNDALKQCKKNNGFM